MATTVKTGNTMSRSKKTRRIKGKLNVKTGSRKDFIKPGEKGKIPSKNKLKKHKNRPKSAYQKYLEEKGLTDESSLSSTTKSNPEPETNETDIVEDDDKSFDELDGGELLDLFNKGK